MKDLIEEKNRIVANHKEQMLNKFSEIMKRNQDAVADRKKEANLGLKVLNAINFNFGGETTIMLNMTGDQRLKLAELWSSDARYLLDAYKDDPGYQSVLKDYDELIGFWREELERLNRELESARNDEEKEKKLEEKRNVMMQA